MLLAVGLTLALTACGPRLEPSKRILGSWRAPDGLTAQFFENGTMALKYPPGSQIGGKENSGTWTLLAGNKISVSAEGFGAAHVCDVTFLNGDRLLVKSPDGTTVCMAHEQNN